MSRSYSPIDHACRGLDGLRARMLKGAAPWMRPFIRHRELRVATFGTSVVIAALALTVLCPFWLLALGPIVCGIPHLVSDLRYLVFKPGLHRSAGFWMLIGAPLAVAGAGFESMAFGLAATAGAVVLAIGPLERKAVVLVVVAALGTGCWMLGNVSQIVFAHLHNVIAVMLWWCWRPRRGWLPALMPALFFLGSLALMLGWLEPVTSMAWLAPSSLPPELHLDTLAGGLAQPWGLRLVLLFAFAQAVHYGVWMRLIPEDDRKQPTPRPFAATFRALRDDMGAAILAIAAMLAAGLAAWAVLDLAEARTGYLRLALFHGYLELAAAALLFIQRPRTSTDCSLEPRTVASHSDGTGRTRPLA